MTPLKVVPAGIAFGMIAGGHSSLNRTVTVYNYGGAAVSLSESITGTNAGDFAVTGGTCGSTLAGGSAHCTYHAEVHAEHRRRRERDAGGQRGRRCGQPAQREPHGFGFIREPRDRRANHERESEQGSETQNLK